jgi:DNA-binding XRE family transcriptional regulator
MEKISYPARSIDQLIMEGEERLLDPSVDSLAFANRLDGIQAASQFVREARRVTGMTQKDFACRAGLSESTIRNLERARLHQSATLETLNRIARAAGKTLRLSLGD